MSRIFGWQTWLPRLLLLTVVLLAVQYALGLAARRAAIRAVESRTGAAVQLAHARVSLADRQVVLRDLRVADPQRPALNLLEADRCELRFVAAPLLRKQAIIEHGIISGLRFGTLRGEISPRAAASSSTGNPTIEWPGDDEAKTAQRWLEQLGQRFDGDLVDRLESVQRTAALCCGWSEHSAALDERVGQLNQRSDELQQQADAAANPLRHGDSLAKVSDEIAAVRQQYENLAAEIAGLTDLFDEERRTIIAARRRDKPWLREQLHVPAADPDALAAYFLREQAARSVGELIHWLQFVRQIVPAQPAIATASPRSGEDVFFAGCPRSPRFLIRSLELQGTTRAGRRTANLRGTISNFASTSSACGEPIRLRLATTGPQPLVLNATIDRTGAVPHDMAYLECPGIFLPEVHLGNSRALRLTIAPALGTLSIRADLDGQRLASDIELVQKQVEVTPDVGGQLSDASFDTEFRRAMKNIDTLATRISLRGTLQRPQCTISSDFGPVVADALDRALRLAADRHARRQLAAAQKRVDAQLAELDRELAETQGRLLPQLAQASGWLEKIAAQQHPPQRISTEQLGRRLPANSLFR